MTDEEMTQDVRAARTAIANILQDKTRSNRQVVSDLSMLKSEIDTAILAVVIGGIDGADSSRKERSP